MNRRLCVRYEASGKYSFFSQDKLHEAIINLTRQKVESNVKLGPNIHAPADVEEILTVEKLALEDEGVRAEIAKLGLPEGTSIVSDPWIYGTHYQHSGLPSTDIIEAPTVSMTTDECTSVFFTCVIQMTRRTKTPITMRFL